MTDKREISLEHLDSTFFKWIEKVREALSKGKHNGDKKGFVCGYCLDHDEHRDKCLIDPKICNASNCHGDLKDGYFEKWSDARFDKKWPKALKYALLILKYTVKEEHRLGYMTKKKEKLYKDTVKLAK